MNAIFVKKKMRLKLLFSFLTISALSFAQAPANKTVFDCNGISKEIYTTLGSGKSIIVAHKGVDCSICVNSAPGWETWAAANTGKVEVWGAITYTFNPNAFSNMCPLTLQWKNTHNWNSIFTFADSTRDWVNGGSPRYYVYSAIDSSIVYQGSSSTTARNMALAQSVVGLQKLDLIKTYNLRVANNQLLLSSTTNKIKSLQIFSIEGKLVVNQLVNETSAEISTNGFTNGMYIVLVEDENGKLGSEKVFF